LSPTACWTSLSAGDIDCRVPWVGDRRWDLVLDSGVNVMLPSEETESALVELTRLETEQQLMERSVESVDLRIPGRLIVRLTKEADEERIRRVKERGAASVKRERKI
jgi:cell division protein FtsQ